MANPDFNDFNALSIPNDAYQRLFAHVAKAEYDGANNVVNNSTSVDGMERMLYRLNGGEIADSFPPYFRSIPAMTIANGQLLAQTYGKVNPALHSFAEMTKRNQLPALLAQALGPAIMRSRLTNLHLMRNYEDRMTQFFATHPNQTILGIAKPELTPSKRAAYCEDVNLSQTHRNVQAVMHPILANNLHVLFAMMQRMEAKLGVSFNFRPLLAMPGNKHQALASFTPPRDIIGTNPAYMNRSGLEAQELLTQFMPLTDRLINCNLADYRYWTLSTVASAECRFPDDSTIALAPAGTQQVLLDLRLGLKDENAEMPAIPLCLPDSPSPLYLDSLPVFIRIHPTQTTLNSAARFAIAHALGTRLRTACADLLWCTALSLTGFFAAPKWGTGVKKPSWTCTPPNAFNLNFLHGLTPYVLWQAQDALEQAESDGRGELG